MILNEGINSDDAVAILKSAQTFHAIVASWRSATRSDMTPSGLRLRALFLVGSLRHGAICGLAVGFTSGAMPGFIVRGVARSESGSAMGFFLVARSIRLTVGSALSAAVLLPHTRHGHSLLEVNGIKVALIIGSAVFQVTAVITFALPGRTPWRPDDLTRSEKRDLEAVMEDDAELGGTGLTVSEEPLP